MFNGHKPIFGLVVVTTSVGLFYLLYIRYLNSIKDKEIRERKERELREYRRIRQLQDEEYLKSVSIDAEKTRKLKEEQERKEREETDLKEQEILEKVLKDSARQEKERSLYEKSNHLKENLPPEPPAEDNNITSLKILLPNGNSLLRRFSRNAPIRQLKDYVEVLRLPEMGGHVIPEQFDLITDFPRIHHRNYEISFENGGLMNVVIKIEEIDFE